MNISYRYLPLEVAVSEIPAVRDGHIDIAGGLAKEDFHLRPFTDSGILETRLLEIRRDIFTLLGVPSAKIADINCSKSNFDSIFTEHVLTLFHDLNPIDGFNKDVWSYLTLRLLPDFALWRWPDNAEERFLGGSERSCFQRLWQRAYVLGGNLASQLKEDEAVNIFERPEAIGGNRLLAVAFATYLVGNRDKLGDSKSGGLINTQVAKQTAKRLRRTMSVQMVQTMTETELTNHVAQAFAATLSS